MPLQSGSTTRDGDRVRYYRWGDDGKMYTYTPGDDSARERAKERALRQGRAIESGTNTPSS